MKTNYKFVVATMALATSFGLAGAPAYAQTTAPGPYYANPSWDQQIPAAQRFIVLSNWNNKAVLDRETGLVWERTPISTTPGGSTETIWAAALSVCAGEGTDVGQFPNTGNRWGWRTPSVQELASLIDSTNGNMLPPGNPFLGVSTGDSYWSATTNASNSGFAWAVGFGGGGLPVFADIKTQFHLIWCVRGGSGPDVQ